MLEGLEVSEIEYSKIGVENRFDSEFYQKIFLENERTLKLKPFFLVGEQFSVTDGEHGSVVEQESGIKYLTAENVKNGYVDISNVRYVNEDVDKRNARARVAIGDILISIKGTLGAIGIAEQWLLPANMNRDVAILKSQGDKSSSAITALFLMSSYGLLQSSRGGSGGVQQMITLERLRKFIHPVFSLEFCDVLKRQMQIIQSSRDLSERAYCEAEQTLLEVVGLADFKPSTQITNIKTFAQSFGTSGRLDAEYYQPKYEEIISKLKSHENGFLKLSEVADTLRGLFVSDDYYADKGNIAYIRGADISSNKLEKGSMVYIDGYLDGGDKNKCEENDIIFSLIGSVGTAAILPSEYIGSIVSNNLGIIRVKDNKIQPLVLHLYLTNSKIGGLLFEQQEMRTAQPKISDKNIHEFPIPKIDLTTQTNISQLVQQSFSLKAQSEHLLSVAKRAVEMAIEQDENVGLAYIIESTKNTD